MSFNLLSILQQSGIIPTPDSPDINVVGKKKVAGSPMASLLGPVDQDADQPVPMRLGNRDFIQQGLQDRENSQPGKGDNQHKGMFGVKGTMRDILGMMGDAFLTQSGNKSVYAPQRQQEKISDAMAGFSQEADPRAYLERLASLPGGAEMAQKAYDDLIQNQTRQGTSQSTVQKNKGEAFKEGSRLFGQYSGAIARNPKLAGQLLPVLQAVKDQYGLGDEFSIPGPDDAAGFEGFQYGGTPTQAQINDTRKVEAEQGRDRRAASQETGRNTRASQAEKGRMARDDAPRPPQPTVAAIAAPILSEAKKRGGFNKLDKTDQDTLNRLGMGPDRGKTEGQLRREARAKRSGSVPAPGTKKGVWTFKGGDPADRNNWVK